MNKLIIFNNVTLENGGRFNHKYYGNNILHKNRSLSLSQEGWKTKFVDLGKRIANPQDYIKAIKLWDERTDLNRLVLGK